MAPRRSPIDRAHKLLALLGWSHGDLCYWQGGRKAWQVYAHRDEDKIVVRTPTQAGAWDEALRQAGIVQRDLPLAAPLDEPPPLLP
jgi:hypothetical protein